MKDLYKMYIHCIYVPGQSTAASSTYTTEKQQQQSNKQKEKKNKAYKIILSYRL